MEVTIDLKDLLKKIFRKWPVLIVFMLLGAICLQFFTAGKAKASAAAAAARHERYSLVAAELPSYFDEQLYGLRSVLSENDALFCEAYAHTYENYIAEYLSGALTEDSTRFEAYMMFMNSYKDVLSVFSGAQRAYYDALILRDLSSTEKGAAVRDYVPAAAAPVSIKWMAIGAILGLLAGAALTALPYLMTGKLRNPGDVELSLGIPVLTTVPAGGAGKAGTDFLSTGIGVLMKNIGASSVLLAGSGAEAAADFRKTLEEKLTGMELRAFETDILSEAPEAVKALGEAHAVVLVEKTGDSRYSDIRDEKLRCDRYGAKLLGCVVID